MDYLSQNKIIDFEKCIEEANASDSEYYDEIFEYEDSDTKPESLDSNKQTPLYKSITSTKTKKKMKFNKSVNVCAYLDGMKYFLQSYIKGFDDFQDKS